MRNDKIKKNFLKQYCRIKKYCKNCMVSVNKFFQVAERIVESDFQLTITSRLRQMAKVSRKYDSQMLLE